MKRFVGRGAHRALAVGLYKTQDVSLHARFTNRRLSYSVSGACLKDIRESVYNQFYYRAACNADAVSRSESCPSVRQTRGL